MFSDYRPQLSVIVPMYNGEAVIASTLDSVARQKDLCAEIIVVDDASPDNGAAVVRQWSDAHADLSVRLIIQPERRYTLQGRLTGLANSSSDDILYLDADDTIIGVDKVAKILAFKKAKGCEIAHFRSQFKGEYQGEANWNAPMCNSCLAGAEIFSSYVSLSFPPVLVWGKIYSASLLRRVEALARELRIVRLEDIFLVSLLMSHARSYCAVDEYAYLYNMSSNWPLEKFAGRVRDLVQMKKFFPKVLSEAGVFKTDVRKFMEFLDRRLIFNMSNLCMELGDCLEQDSDTENTLERLLPFLDIDMLLACTASVLAKNLKKNSRQRRRLANEY